MDIRTIHYVQEGNDSTNGFLVNKNVDANDDRQLCVPDDMGNRHRVMIQEWLDAGGVVADWVDPSTPYQIWHNKIHLSDRDMPRIYEDILDRDGTDGLPQVVIDRYNAKKALRATKPKE